MFLFFATIVNAQTDSETSIITPYDSNPYTYEDLIRPYEEMQKHKEQQDEIKFQRELKKRKWNSEKRNWS